MEVAERDVVEAVEHGDGHLLRAADAERPLALALEAAGDEGVRHEHVTLVRVRGRESPADACGRDRLLVVDVVGAVHGARDGGVGERQRADAHRPVLVAQDEGRGSLRQLAHHVQAALAQQPAGEAHPGRAVVVAGDGDDGHAEVVDQTREHVVEQAHGLRGRHGAVVEVAGDDDGRRPHLPCELDQLLEHVRLVLGEVLVVEQAAEMPVGGVDEPHGADPTTAPGRRPEASGRPATRGLGPPGGPARGGGIQWPECVPSASPSHA